MGSLGRLGNEEESAVHPLDVVLILHRMQAFDPLALGDSNGIPFQFVSCGSLLVVHTNSHSPGYL